MENTAKNFALQLGSLITLYISVGFLISLLFSVITVQYPDVAQGYWEQENAMSTIRFSIAMLVVFFPTYIILTRCVNSIRRKEQGTYLALTKWLIYLSLLVGGGVLLGDLVAVLNGFLEGELTIRFILKALAVLLVVGTACTYYLLDARGYWQAHERHSIYYGTVMSVVVITSLVAGFLHTQTPQEVREMKLDATQITDLQNIQAQIATYTNIHGTLPGSIEDAFTPIDAPTAPKGRTPYIYEMNGTESFKLCANFSTDSSLNQYGYYGAVTITEPLSIKNPDDWSYKSGHWCFTRYINPPQAK